MKGCKDCPAYAKCTVTYRGSACAALRGTYGIDSDPEIIANADRVRAMSDEKLAEFLCSVFDDEDCNGKYIFGVTIKDYDEYSILDWLKQPAEEGT